MKLRRRLGFVLALLTLATLLTWHWNTRAEPPAMADPNRLEFTIIESYDAMYLGDTPGHHGRTGNLKVPPEVALGDPVFRGTTRVGKVTQLKWDRSRESIDIEFDPEPMELAADGRVVGPLRLAIGQTVWLPLHPQDAPKEAVRTPSPVR